ncbi:MAG: LytTR family transcriptional regulator [Phycisphaera sp.]|nr:MAG: LytTR family transcriptional regulator [Phycisphaera sp.]
MPAVLSSTQQWAQLQDSPKHMSWIASFLYQLPSWLVLWITSPGVILLARRWPIEGQHRLAHLGRHLLIALVFGSVFLFVSIPLRRVFHPNGVVWSFFGPSVFKSGPQFIAVGALCYGLLVLIGALLDTRARLRVIEGNGNTEPETKADTPRLVIETRSGQAIISPAEVLWVEPGVGGGCVLRTESGEVRVRPALSEMEERFADLGFVRVHRSRLVNVSRIVEVKGGAHREGDAVLDTGDVVPVSRRRRGDLEVRLGS